MAAKKSAPKQTDPTAAANARILAQRQERIRAAQPEPSVIPDLDLRLQSPEPASAAEMLADEFDRRNFGDPIPTYTRIIYGPDPLLEGNPEFKERLEKLGLEEFASATYDAILKRQHMAVPDPMMRKGLQKAIAKFGVQAVAQAFADRIMRIPTREVEIEADRQDLEFGNPLEELVKRYGTPGFAPKFLNPVCIDALGMRGYRLVKDENGDVVKWGKLLMGEIPQRIADRRRFEAANESRSLVQSAEEDFSAAIEKVASASRGTAGFRPLRRDEVVNANATEEESFIGQQRTAGYVVEENQLLTR